MANGGDQRSDVAPAANATGVVSTQIVMVNALISDRVVMQRFKKLITILEFSLILTCLFCAKQAEAAVEPDRIVVMISLDGLAGYYLDDPKADMPTIRALAADGARAATMKVSNPTVTWVNHTTLMTGDNPARHGVVGNNYYDRVTGKLVTLISDPVYDKDEIVKVPTIYDLSKATGLKTAAIRWPASRNAATLDWRLPDVATNALLEQCITPSLVVAPANRCVPTGWR